MKLTGGRHRRTVTTIPTTKPGKGIKLWAYGYESLARLFGMTPNAVRQAAHQKRFDPASLESIVTFLDHSRLAHTPIPQPEFPGGSPGEFPTTITPSRCPSSPLR